MDKERIFLLVLGTCMEARCFHFLVSTSLFSPIRSDAGGWANSYSPPPCSNPNASQTGPGHRVQQLLSAQAVLAHSPESLSRNVTGPGQRVKLATSAASIKEEETLFSAASKGCQQYLLPSPIPGLLSAATASLAVVKEKHTARPLSFCHFSQLATTDNS